MMTVVDILRSQSTVSEEAIKLSILCCIRHPTFTTIRSDLLAHACLSVITGENKEDILVKVIKNYLSTFLTWAESVLKLDKEYLDIVETYSEENTEFVLSKVSFPLQRKNISNRREYEVIRELGQGASSTVFLAVREEKVIAVKRDANDDENKGYLKELAILSTYKHKNLVKLYNFYIDKDILEFELEAGVSLQELIFGKSDPFKGEENEQPLLEDRETISDDIIRGVKYLHSVGVLHNDIKPANVIVVAKNGKRRAKLIDFGLSDLMVLSPRKDTEIQTIVFRSPELLSLSCGTIEEEIIKIEEFKGYLYGPDIWAVGTTLLTLETGMIPFLPTIKPTVDKEDVGDAYLNYICGILKKIQDTLEGNNDILGRIESPKARERIIGMLKYNPDARVLA